MKARFLALALLAIAVAACAPVTRVFIEFREPPTPTPTEAPLVTPTPTVSPSIEPTTAPEPTYEPITFTDITVEDVGPDYAIISWSVDPPAQGQVTYGLTPDYGQATKLETRLLDFHRQRISGLQPETTYHFAVVAFIPDPDGGEPLMALVPVR